MVSEDAAVTTVSFDGNPSTIITHKSTTITDVYGSRSLTMVFSGDNKAYSKLADGTEVLLSSITTRATEFETPESMPAKLPPNSAYTYCSELTVDGAKNVRFEKPVTVYVDNFLGFRVGEKVPVGYYDRDRAVWVPSDNGVVVRLLDTNGDGIVDSLDSTGDSLPDDLNGNGSFSDEATGLNDPNKYNPNATYWRVNMTHFTPWDCNWPYGPPADATPPNGGEPSLDEQQDKDDIECTNSYCESRSRVFHEDIPIPGTDMTLHYASNRVKGYKSIITIPASGATVPSSLKNIIVKMELAGRTFETTLNPLPNQKVEYIWDGLDYLGNPVVGSRTANISIGFVYQAVYYSSATAAAQAFAQAGTDVTGIRARQEVTSWKRSTVIVHRGGGIDSIAAGWTLSAHHYLNPSDPNTLYKGDGTTIKNDARIITTIAGNGQSGYSGDDVPATQAGLYYPTGVAVDNAGNIYIADKGDYRIRKVDTDGIITTVAGNGQSGYSGDGGPATQASLNWPQGVAVDNAGNIYIADAWNNRIRKVSYPAAFAGSTVVGDIAFSDENGQGYILDSRGLHKSTMDLATGKILLTFAYNQDKKLISITDQFGNQTTIQRDAQGIPTSITSPDGIITNLTIDSSNNLTKATYPDSASYSFTYTTDDLMTDEYDPKNNHFVHQFDANGRITDIFDPEGGSWNYSRTVDNSGNIFSSILTGEGNPFSWWCLLSLLISSSTH